MEQTARRPPNEKLSPLARKLVMVFGSLLFLSLVTGIVLSRWPISIGSDSANQALFSSLQNVDPAALLVQIEDSRVLTSGPGLSEWFADFAQFSGVKKIIARYSVSYSFDPKGDWDLQSLEDGIWRLSAPDPEYKSLALSEQGLDVESTPALSAEDLALAKQIVQEKLSVIIRVEEKEERKARLPTLKEQLRSFLVPQILSKNVAIDPAKIQIVFSSELREPTEAP